MDTSMEVGVAMTSGVEAKIWGNPEPLNPWKLYTLLGKSESMHHKPQQDFPRRRLLVTLHSILFSVRDERRKRVSLHECQVRK